MKGLRAAFAKRVRETLGPMVEQLRFVDESGVHLGLTRLFGRASPEERVVEGTPGYYFIAGLERRLRESGLFHRDFDP